jgi:hypothetical protein
LLDAVPADTEVQSNVPEGLMSLATEIDRGFDPVSLVWDDAKSQLTIWVDPGSDTEPIERKIRDAKASNVVVKPAAYSEDQLEAASEAIVEAGYLSGAQVAWAGVKPDGSGVDVGVVEEPSLRAQSAQKVGGIPVSVVVDGEAEPTSRDYDAGPEFIAGADMSRPSTTAGRIQVCSTSFALYGFYNGTWEEQLFTADHCIASGGVGTTWRTGRYIDSPVIGNHITGGTETDIGKIRGKDYAGYMYLGPNTSNTAALVRGYWAPVVGSWVHYSGAPSGTVYNNQITHTNLTVNYGNVTYPNLVRTVQRDGDPAVGNGDSGGPVFALNSNGQVLATGVISGMSNATGTCAGDPAVAGGRQCSATAFFAPLSAYFATHPEDEVLTID